MMMTFGTLAKSETGCVAPMTQDHLRAICEIYWPAFRQCGERQLRRDLDKAFGKSTSEETNE